MKLVEKSSFCGIGREMKIGNKYIVDADSCCCIVVVADKKILLHKVRGWSGGSILVGPDAGCP